MSTLSLASDALAGTPAAGAIEYNGQFYGTDSNASRAQIQRITLSTSQNSTSGTSIDFTGIPAWAKRITIMFFGTSTVAANDFIIQLGTGATPTYTTSGYASGSAATTGTTAAATTAGFMVFNPNAGASYYGPIVLNLVDAATFKWTEGHTLGRSDNRQGIVGGGIVTLAAAVTAVRITTIAGTTTFSGGSINILYEG